MIIELVVLFLTVVILVDYLVKKRRNDLVKDIPGFRNVPIFGSTVIFKGVSLEKMLPFITDNVRKYGPLLKFWVFTQLGVSTIDTKDVEVVLSSTKLIKKNRLYDLLLPWLGTGLLMSTGKKWYSRRKVITPAFHFSILEQFVEVFNQQGDILVEKLKAKADGKAVINVQPDICLAALDIITETAMGTTIHAQTNANCQYAIAVNESGAILAKRFMNAWLLNDFVFRLFNPKMFKQLQNNIKLMHNFTDNIIRERRNTLLERQNSAFDESQHGYNEDDNVSKKRKRGLLDILLQSNIDGKPLTDEDIREEVDTFMFEGHDTTTSALSFALYEISRHPMVQKKLFEEIYDKFGESKNITVTQRNLSELKYLECVIKETLRLYPAVPLIGRNFHEDVKINGHIIPRGTNFDVNIYSMMREPKYFPEPDIFKPERHFPGHTNEKINIYAFIPFSAGPRNCIGQKFAMSEMKSVLVKIVRNFELLPLGEPVKPILNLILRSINGMQLGLKIRD